MYQTERTSFTEAEKLLYYFYNFLVELNYVYYTQPQI